MSPKSALLLRLTKLVERVYQVPVAYIAVLGPDPRITTRIGSDCEHWDSLMRLPLATAPTQPMIWPEPVGDLCFVASTPLRSSEGLCLGVLVIGDVQPRPAFSRCELETLTGLAGLPAGQMELRVAMGETRETELLLRETECRFRTIADAAPLLLIYSGSDGASSFVNKAWLDFTGRRFEDETGAGFEAMFHPDYRETVMQIYWESFEAHKPLTVEFQRFLILR